MKTPLHRLRRRLRSCSACLLASSMLTAPAQLPSSAVPATTPGRWVASWTTAQEPATPGDQIPITGPNGLTLRQIVHLSLGGNALRIHLSNVFGTEPLRIDSVRIGNAGSTSSPAVTPGSDRALTFNGTGDVLIPAGAEYLSDPVRMPIAAQSNLVISMHLAQVPAQQTCHSPAHATSWYVPGNRTSAATLADAQAVEHWYQLATVDVLAPAGAAAIAAFGDSITDGDGSTTNGNDRWPDLLATRLLSNAATRNISIANEGIGGNRLLFDGGGPNALARFDRDVLAVSGVRWMILLEGINDIGGLSREGVATPLEHQALIARILAAYQQIIVRTHAHGIKVIGATITPFVGSVYYQPGPISEADRQAVNTWIRTPGHFDAVVDFDQIVRDPRHPDHLLPAFDKGDHLHPSPAGYQAMANAIPLTLFTR